MLFCCRLHGGMAGPALSSEKWEIRALRDRAIVAPAFSPALSLNHEDTKARRRAQSAFSREARRPFPSCLRVLVVQICRRDAGATLEAEPQNERAGHCWPAVLPGRR